MESLCSEFQVGSSGIKAYIGNLLIDEENLCLVVGMNKNIGAFGALGGAIGGAIVGAVAHLSGGSPLPFETTFEKLPSELRAKRGWGRVTSATRVIVLPKTEFIQAKFSIWTGCTIKTGGQKFVLTPSVFRIGRAKRLLRQYGWIA